MALKAALNPRITGISFTPLSEYVLVRRDPPKTETASGIAIADAHAAQATTGTVLAVGRGRILPNGTRVDPQVKGGDRIAYGVHSGLEIDINLGPGLVILQEDEILGKGIE